MPLNLPSLRELRERVANDFEFRITGADAHTRGTGYTELAQVVAGIAHGLYGNQAWIAQQLFVATMDDETVVRVADERGIPRIQSTFAAGSIALTGNTDAYIGTEVMWKSNAGVEYRTVSTATLVAGAGQVALIAQTPGSIGNLPAGTKLTLVNPVMGIDKSATVAALGIANGADIEPIERLRARLLEHFQRPPMGGKDYDYIAWARAASVSVSRAWVAFHENGFGSVTVRFVAEDLADPIPAAPLIALVTDYIVARRPSGVRNLLVLAPAPASMNLTFTKLTNNTPAVKAAIEAEVKDLIRREYVSGGKLLLTHIHEAISNATGEVDHAITLNADLTYAVNQFPVWGVPTWPAP
jgi:uncharacterized phage protein gp47/JayE